jgi:hypothetical protein
MICQVDRLQITRYLRCIAVLLKRQDPDLLKASNGHRASHKALVNAERLGLRYLLVVVDETTCERRVAQHQGLKCAVIYTLWER